MIYQNMSQINDNNFSVCLFQLYCLELPSINLFVFKYNIILFANIGIIGNLRQYNFINQFANTIVMVFFC